MFWFRRFLVIGIIALALTAGAGGPDDRIFTDSFESCKDFVVPEGAVEWDGGGDGESWFDPLNRKRTGHPQIRKEKGKKRTGHPQT